mmetsp:Transcript_92144/g.263331  ORF Transcript_92144/g.263331 Transcript_92144/m.263331 type:complete len:209 (+) Transcript_92144:496-1122(+)
MVNRISDAVRRRPFKCPPRSPGVDCSRLDAMKAYAFEMLLAVTVSHDDGLVPPRYSMRLHADEKTVWAHDSMVSASLIESYMVMLSTLIQSGEPELAASAIFFDLSAYSTPSSLFTHSLRVSKVEEVMYSEAHSVATPSTVHSHESETESRPAMATSSSAPDSALEQDWPAAVASSVVLYERQACMEYMQAVNGHHSDCSTVFCAQSS